MKGLIQSNTANNLNMNSFRMLVDLTSSASIVVLTFSTFQVSITVWSGAIVHTGRWVWRECNKKGSIHPSVRPSIRPSICLSVCPLSHTTWTYRHSISVRFTNAITINQESLTYSAHSEPPSGHWLQSPNVSLVTCLNITPPNPAAGGQVPHWRPPAQRWMWSLL